MASNPYTQVSISGYNTSPPTDDGSTASGNRVLWSTTKNLIGDPLKTGIEGVDQAAYDAFATLSALIVPFVGDSGSGGVRGLVPAPSAGDAASRTASGRGPTLSCRAARSVTGPSTTTGACPASNATDFASTWSATSASMNSIRLATMSGWSCCAKATGSGSDAGRPRSRSSVATSSPAWSTRDAVGPLPTTRSSMP